MQRKPTSQRGPIGVPSVVCEALRRAGQPLDTTTRGFMEPRFLHDFSRVRVHADDKAGESARAVNALAFTVGEDVVFATGRYAPSAEDGRRLLAHELAHVVQQAGSPASRDRLTVGPPEDQVEREADAAATRILRDTPIDAYRPLVADRKQSLRRDLATEPPAAPAPVQPNLTPAQIQAAIAFNRVRYDQANTRLIQNLLGGPVTGAWTPDNIEAIAATQEEFGLPKDGKVGDATFRFLNREQRLEGMSTRTPDCLVSFRLIGPDRAAFGRDDPTHCHFGGHFSVEGQFSPRCNCDGFEYRQFIRGHWHRTRGGVVTDLPIREPGGMLPAAFIEDTDIAAAVPHYGHRADAAETNPEDHYIDRTGADDQLHGCGYRMQDFPGFPPGATFDDCLRGDQYDLLTDFRGEIQRNGAAVQSKFWTGIDIRNWHP
jgi:hypothetical protein